MKYFFLDFSLKNNKLCFINRIFLVIEVIFMNFKLLLFAYIAFIFMNYGVSCQEKNERILASTIKFKTLENNEQLCVGSQFQIQWEGVADTTIVTIEYSTNGGINWITITDNASGLSYNWTIPNTPSDNCIARVIAPIPKCSENWSSTNLNVTHYRNGDSIPEVRDGATWVTLTTGAWCYYNNDPSTGAVYGKLYNWYAVNDSRGLAPLGWHIPSDTEWKTLEKCLGMTQTQADGTGYRGTNEGGKMKEIGTTHWRSPNTGANNESGLNILPAGFRNVGNGNFSFLGQGTYYWTSTLNNPSNVWIRHIIYNSSQIYRYYDLRGHGFPVRCVKD